VVVLCEEEKGNVNAEDVVEWAKGHMAAYKYPRSVEFIDALLKSGSGKILWRELQEREQQELSAISHRLRADRRPTGRGKPNSMNQPAL
jgi:fatty-acyl-CoA synthase